MPVLAVGAEKSFGAGHGGELRFAASKVTGGTVPASGTGSWRKTRSATVDLVTAFLKWVRLIRPAAL